MMEDRPQAVDGSSFDDNQEEFLGNHHSPTAPKGFADLSKRQKGLAGLLVLLFIMIVIVMGANAKSFFLVPISNQDNSDENKQSVEELFKSEEQRVAEDKQKDTDQDGLNDYDELNKWKTSPYLADSDSDTLTDKAEIDMGTDPNCPEGKECAIEKPAAENETETESTAVGGVPTAAEIRSILLASGLFTADDLAAVNDDELVTMYKQMAAEDQAPTTTGPEKESPASYTIDELKQILRQNGVDEETLSKVSDEELRQMFEDAWTDVEKTP